ncbi:hypothetical protein Tco_1498977 [Tanacetum coccineum]
MSFFLGLQVSQSPRGIFINQAKYALETLKKYGMDLSDPVDTLCEDTQYLSLGDLIRSGYQQKDRKPSQNDKTEHGMEKTVQNQGQSPKMPKSESIQKNQQSNRSRN